MAKIRAGVLGNTRGKVGGVVGGQFKDVNYIREYVKPANPNTAAQQTQRGKMSDCVEFCKPLVGPVFNAYTDRFLKHMSGFNFFIKRAIAEFDGSPVYANIKMTEGKLYFGGIVSAIHTATPGSVAITFSTAVGNNGADTDKVYASVIHVPTGVWSFPVVEVDRSVGLTSVSVADGLDPADFQAWAWAAKYQNTLVTVISDSDHQQVA